MTRLRRYRNRCHPACIACGARNGGGLGLRFTEQADGSVSALFDCGERYQGYPDRLHGGVIAMLMDAAMTHCLFVRGITAVTGKMNLRIPHPVKLGTTATIYAELVREATAVYELKAEVSQRTTVCATAEALFAKCNGMVDAMHS